MVTKEVIYAEGDGSDYLHSELYETAFDSDNFRHTIFTKNRWKGKVKITIEKLKEMKNV